MKRNLGMEDWHGWDAGCRMQDRKQKEAEDVDRSVSSVGKRK